jgi:membrane protein YdbS with pleckstrin-like domain
LPAVFIIWLANGLPWLALIALVLAGALVVAVLGWHAHYWPPIAYRHASYRVDELGIEIRRGVHWRSAINVPRSRVQHTDVSQGPLERQHGLATLVVYTAGTDHSKVDLGGLDHAVALRIREHLLPPGKSDAV